MSSLSTIRRSYWYEPQTRGVASGDYNHESPLYSYDFVRRCAIGTAHFGYHTGKAPCHSTTSGSATTTDGADPGQCFSAPGSVESGLTARNESAPGNRTAPWRPPPDKLVD